MNKEKNNYYRWLLRKIRYDPKKDDEKILKMLFNKEFRWICPNDDNRAADGINLRYQFDPDYISDDPCSVLEMMVGLADRCDMHIMGEPGSEDNTAKWFWIMYDNLEMVTYKKDMSFEEAVENWMNRKFDRDGFGGLFPLKYPSDDQRKVEIWFQLCGFLDENFSFI